LLLRRRLRVQRGQTDEQKCGNSAGFHAVNSI
jgi:hypothetical protein